MEIIVDLHMHSTHSFDGKNSVDEMCQAAISRGMKHICFTEHYDVNPKSSSYKYFSRDKYDRDIDECREKFGDSLEILKGIEFGEPHLHPKDFDAVRDAGFDVILGAIHWIGDTPAVKLATTDIAVDRLFELYFEEILAAVEFGGFDVLAHMDLPKRHIGRSCSLPDLTRKIFDAMLRNGIIPEVNTSTCGTKVGEPSPNLQLLQQWVSVGGRELVIGSDAHKVDSIGQSFVQAKQLIEETQLSYGLFRKRHYHRLG